MSPGQYQAAFSVLFQALEKLDLSFNPLGNDIAGDLGLTVKGLSTLASLALSSCHLTVKVLQHNRPALAAVLQGKEMKKWAAPRAWV